MYAVSDERRTFFMRLSILVVCGGVAILPFTVPPTSATARAQPARRTPIIAVPDVPAKLSFPAIDVERDPFIADTTPVTAGSSGSEQDIGIVLPPNAGAEIAPPVAAGSAIPVVRGIVLGDAPEALVDVGTGVKVMSVGDLVSGDRIRAIDAGGVTLSSGLRLRISGAPK